MMARDSSLSRLRPSAIKRPRFTTDATLPPSGGDLLGDAAVWLLRMRRERPRRRAAEERDELAPFHSITSSARASSVGGTSRPSVLAVLRLITNSYLVGFCTGRLAGFSPLRMRST
jgi:hypothetical protein